MKTRDIAPFGFRAQPEVMAALEEAAKRAGRSKNGQLNQYVLLGLRMDGINIRKPAKGNAPRADTPEALMQVPPTAKAKEPAHEC